MRTTNTAYEEIKKRFEEIDSLADSLKKECDALHSEMDWLLADELTKGVQIGSLLIPELLAVIDAAVRFREDIRFDHELLRSGKTSRQQLVDSVDQFEDYRSDMETILIEKQSEENSKIILDIESANLESVSEEYRRLALERGLYDRLAELWRQAKKNVLEKEAVA